MNNKVNLEALVVRAFKTFLQAFLAAVSLGVVTTTNVPTLRALIVGAIAAGISAAMNVILAPQEAK